MIYNIPNSEPLTIETLVFDLNGTLSNYGRISRNTRLLLKTLKRKGFRLILISSDQRGNAADWAKRVGMEFYTASTTEQKKQQVEKLQLTNFAAVGNARVDLGLFEDASLRIGTLQQEGLHTAILPHVDILVGHIDHALTLFLDTDAMCATLKT